MSKDNGGGGLGSNISACTQSWEDSGPLGLEEVNWDGRLDVKFTVENRDFVWLLNHRQPE